MTPLNLSRVCIVSATLMALVGCSGKPTTEAVQKQGEQSLKSAAPPGMGDELSKMYKSGTSGSPQKVDPTKMVPKYQQDYPGMEDVARRPAPTNPGK